MREQAISALQTSTENLVQALQSFPEERFLNAPSPGKWSAAGIGEHLLVLEELINQVLVGPVKKVDRLPDEKVEKIKNTFLNYDEKLYAGGPIQPKGLLQNKAQIITKILECRQTLTGILQSHDLTEECIGFSHALFGKLTRLEWVYFNVYHTQRHLHQMEKLLF